MSEAQGRQRFVLSGKIAEPRNSAANLGQQQIEAVANDYQILQSPESSLKALIRHPGNGKSWTKDIFDLGSC